LISTEEQLRQYQTRVRADLELASQIQKSLLPQKSPFIRGVRTSWLFEPCDELAGDSLNIFALDDKHVGFYVLDVAGHGMAASLISVSASHFLSPYSEYSFLRGIDARRIQDSTILCPHEVLGRLNDQFCSHPSFSGFLTLAYGILDTESKVLAYASAGHTPIAHQSGGKIQFLRQGGLPIGVMGGAEYPVERIELRKSDRIYLYSDGVTEAKTARGDLFGETRLRSVLESSKVAPIDQALQNTFTAIQSCVEGSKLADDVTMLGIEIA
jgi:sigma-B regulation protein RsbU (phosphoserine phosphatase)